MLTSDRMAELTRDAILGRKPATANPEEAEFFGKVAAEVKAGGVAEFRIPAEWPNATPPPTNAS